MPLAFGFESLPMLGWLAAAAAPWLIHLLSRRKYRETAWAAMDFLLAAVKRRTRRIRIEQWLLLLVRSAVVIVLVMAVAQPYLERAATLFSPNGNTHRVLVIDSSYSMAYQAGDRTRFEQAKQWAARIVEQSSPGDGFTLLQMASPPRVIVATPGLEKGPLRQEIQNLELLHTGADLAATLAEVRKLLDTARRDSPWLTRHEVCFFTDLQRGTWLPAMNDAARAEFRSRAAGLAAIAQLQVIDLGQPGDDNLAVTSLDLRDRMVLVGRSVTLEAGVRDFGRVARRRQAVDLLVDGRPAGRQYVNIPAGAGAVARFNVRFESPGDHAVEARLTGDPLRPSDVHAPADPLEIDNHRYLAVNVRPAIRVLCVDGRPAGDPSQSSVFNLRLALSSRSDPNRPSPIDLQIAPESAVLERRPKRPLRLRNAFQRGPIHGQRGPQAGRLPGAWRQPRFLPRRSGHRRQLQQHPGGPGSRRGQPVLRVPADPPGAADRGRQESSAQPPRSAGLPAPDRAEIPRSGKGGIAPIAHRPILQSQAAGSGRPRTGGKPVPR